MFMLVLFSMGVIGWVWNLIVTAVRWIVGGSGGWVHLVGL